MSILVTLYRSLVPEALRYKILRYRESRKQNLLKHEILAYYSKHPSGDNELNEALQFLQHNSLSVFPYTFSKKYKPAEVEVFSDAASQLHYVMYNNHRLYFKRGLTVEQIRHAYSFLLCEQDKESPHCYLVDDFKMKDGATLADVGCAEGIFTLMNIERLEKAVLFEADKNWIEALEHTFKPWKEKVSIVNKFVADVSKDEFISLDDHFKNSQPDFLKIDVDGAEENLLKGAQELLSKNNLQIALCTYHKHPDAEKFNALFKELGYKTSFSKNYMLFYFEAPFGPPYFRKALLRASNG